MSNWTDPSVLAASLSAVAAIAAAIATWRGPISAARMAEQLRSQSSEAEEVRRVKLNVFAAVMQGRAEIYSEDTVRALNMIDIAFVNSIPVREAWAELHASFGMEPQVPHVRDERVRRLLKEMAKDLGLSESLRQDDFTRVYFPTAIAEASYIRDLERKQALARLTGQQSPATNIAENQDGSESKWPPKPT